MNLPVQRMPVARSLGQTRLRSGGVVASEGMIANTLATIDESVRGILPVNATPCAVATATEVVACGGALTSVGMITTAMFMSGGTGAAMLLEGGAGLIPIVGVAAGLCAQANARRREQCGASVLPVTAPPPTDSTNP